MPLFVRVFITTFQLGLWCRSVFMNVLVIVWIFSGAGHGRTRSSFVPWNPAGIDVVGRWYKESGEGKGRHKNSNASICCSHKCLRALHFILHWAAENRHVVDLIIVSCMIARATEYVIISVYLDVTCFRLTQLERRLVIQISFWTTLHWGQSMARYFAAYCV